MQDATTRDSTESNEDSTGFSVEQVQHWVGLDTDRGRLAWQVAGGAVLGAFAIWLVWGYIGRHGGIQRLGFGGGEGSSQSSGQGRKGKGGGSGQQGRRGGGRR